MDIAFTDAEEQFRVEARAWLEANVPDPPLPSMDTSEGFEAHRAWEHRMADERWSVVAWPVEYGGRGASIVEWLIFEEEYWRAGAPGRVSQNGIFLLAPTVFEFGTDEQKQRFLPPMARADDVWAQGWSEPDSGSDLASLRTRADRRGDAWVLNGQKTWCSRAAYADWIFVLARSDPASERHRGLTYFLVPLTADGVTVRPIPQLDGEPGFAEVFFDDVRVPDENVLGGVGEGWRVAMSTAGQERGLSLRSPGRFLATAERLAELWRERPDPRLREDVAQAWIDADAYRLFTFGTVTRLLGGAAIGAESSVNKLFWSDLDVRMHETALSLLGERGLLTSAAPDVVPPWLDGWLFSLAGPIYAGTNEIQRSVVAERVLELPRER